MRYTTRVGTHYEAIDWYKLPRYYDLVFSSLNREEIAFIIDLYQSYGFSANGRMLEPACGSGRLLEGLARRGFRVDGFDLSPDMVDFAQKRMSRKGLSGDIWVDDMASFKTKRRYDFAFCLVSSFKYLLTEAQALGHLQSVSAALKPGGIYALGFHLSEYEDRRKDHEEWSGARGRTKVHCRIDSWPPDQKSRLEKIRARMTVTMPTRTATMESEWMFRTYSREEFLRLIRKCPDLEHVATHNFDYQADEEIELGEDDLDSIVILRRR